MRRPTKTRMPRALLPASVSFSTSPLRTVTEKSVPSAIRTSAASAPEVFALARRSRARSRWSICGAHSATVPLPPYDRPGRERLGRGPRHERHRGPSEGPLHALLHRDVGALQLLRHEGHPHPVHGHAGVGRRPRASTPRRRPASTVSTPAPSTSPRFPAGGSPIVSSACSARVLVGASSSLSATTRCCLLGRRSSSTPAWCSSFSGPACLKANISSIVGSALRPDDPRRDAGFSIFYMGINLGGLHQPPHLRLPRPEDRLALGLRRRRTSA